MSRPLSESDEWDLLRLAAELVLGDGFRPDAAVTKAVDLLAKGIEGDATVALAMQPADPRSLDGIERSEPSSWRCCTNTGWGWQHLQMPGG